MKWRTDKPTADVIVAVLKWHPCHFEILEYDKQLQKYVTESHLPIHDNDIEKWADLEEDEMVTDCDQLEEEIQTQLEVQLCGGYGGWNDGLTDAQLKDFARYFAKWGAEHLKNDRR